MRRALPWLVGALAVVTGLCFAGTTPDDTFISLRYARNLAAGEGLVFNPGERVEGFSNPLWTLVLSACLGLGLPALLTAKLLGVAVFAATVALTARLQDRAFPGAAWPVLLTPPLFLALDPFSALSAPSGMETPLAALLVLCLLAALLRASTTRAGATTGVVLGLLCLTRPEAPLYALVAAPFLLRAGGWRAAVQAAVAAAVVFGPYLAFRIAYYHDLLPNTAYAKRTAGFLELLADGLLYLRWWCQVLGIWVWVLLGTVLVAAIGLVVRPLLATRRVAALALSILLVQVAFVLLVGGDWMEGFRFLVPAAPALALALGAGSACLPRLSGLVLAALLLVQAGAAAGLVARLPGWRERLFRIDRVGPWHAMLQKLEDLIPRGSLVAAHEMGNLGFRLQGRRLLDLWGLTDRDVARSPHNLGMLHGTSGDAELVMGRRPDFVVAWELSKPDAQRHIQAVVVELMRTRTFRLEYAEIARFPETERTQGGWLQETVVWRRQAPQLPDARSPAVDVEQPATLEQVLEGLYREQDGLRWCAERLTVLLQVPPGATVVQLTGGFPPGAELRCRAGNGEPGPSVTPAPGLQQVEFPLPPLPAGTTWLEVTLLGKPAMRDARDPRHKVFVLQRVSLK